MLSIKDFCYTYFNPLGRALLGLYKGVEGKMEAANMKIHPEVYLSVVSFLSVVASSVPLTFLVFRDQRPDFPHGNRSAGHQRERAI